MSNKQLNQNYSKWQLTWLVALRVTIGWHFLYEGMVKVINPNWSSVSYLLDSSGWFEEWFLAIAANPETLRIADFLNIWGLIAIGAGLILGAFSQFAKWAGIILLSFYYLSHPPFIGLSYGMPMEGSYLLVNKVLIELIALVVLVVFPTSKQLGLDRFIFNRKK